MIRFLQTPGPIKKIVLGGMLIIICVAMLVYLIPTGGTSAFGGPGQGVLATVSGQEITTQEVDRAAKQALKQQYPRGGPEASMLLAYIVPQAAQQLIQQKIIVTEAERLGFRATDDEVRDELQHGRYSGTFFPGGNFIGQTAYEELLQRYDLTPTQFEREVKNEILFSKLHDLVAGSATVTDAEVHQEFEKQNTKVKFDYAVLRKEDVLKEIHPAESELKAFYERNQKTYANSIPEKRKIRYILVDTGKIEAQTPATREDLQAYYDQHRDDYRVPEQVNARQILIKNPLPGADGKVDANGVEAARKKAEDVSRQLKAGGSFADLAAKYSEDPATAKNGGAQGWIQRGRFGVPEVDNAAFLLPKGGTSDVINAGYGFVVLHIDDKQAAHMKTLDEVKDQIEPIIKQQKAARIAENQANALLAQARSEGLDKAAAAKGLEVVSTDFVARTDALPGVGMAPQLMDEVFKAAEKSPPEEAQLPLKYAIFEVLAVKPPATPSFEEIRSRVETEFKNERSASLLSQKTRELSDRAKAAHDLKKAAKELNATMKTSDFLGPDGQVPEIGAMSGGASLAFTMKPGEISGPIDNGVAGAVLSVVERQEPAEQEFAAKKDQIRESLLQAKQQEIFALFVSNLREQLDKAGKIVINQEEMKKLTRTPNSEEGG